jgi:hypothetical protein
MWTMKKSIPLAVAVIGTLLASALGASACSPGESTVTNSTAEFVNPGAALAPTANEDWYELLAREKEHGTSLQIMSDELAYEVVLRQGESKVLTPNWITVVDQTLSDGTVVRGYTLRYDDRIALFITPTDREMDVQAEIETRVITPDIKGETHPWHVVTVCGLDGVARSATTQKWESGDTMALPSVVEWQVASRGPAPFLRYALVGDAPVGQLISMAAQLK